MTDSKRLIQIIEESGVRKGFIADKLGISRTALDNKLKKGVDFKAQEMFVLMDILHLTQDEAREIFFYTGK